MIHCMIQQQALWGFTGIETNKNGFGSNSAQRKLIITKYKKILDEGH